MFLVALLVLGTASGQSADAQYDFDQPPINYSRTAPDDAVARLGAQIDSGEIELEYDTQRQFLPALLEALDVPVSSQTLVFSKTSVQDRHVATTNPRAIYFNDDVYVGWIPGAPHIEIAAVDPELGGVFYRVIDRNRRSRLRSETVREQFQTSVSRVSSRVSSIEDIIQPRFARGDCMRCHATRRTERIPGFLVRSVFPDEDGTIILPLGTTDVDQTTPFEERFGGWYVTGQHGEMRHRGNAIANRDADPPLDMEAFANVSSLEQFPFVLDRYLSPESDIVAGMLLAHQSVMHNLITKAAFETRQALYQQREMNDALERDEGFLHETTRSRINGVADALVEYLLFSGEFELTSPVEGSADFAEHFQSLGPFDSKGRSLRQFDLQTRMFKYPCSYLIYSDSFDFLPEPVLQLVLDKLLDVLTGDESSEKFAHLSADDRQAILEILVETKPIVKERLESREP
ncbi:MAG: hypothetical protein AAF456_24010 [Planctomycetota bacterium]